MTLNTLQQEVLSLGVSCIINAGDVRLDSDISKAVNNSKEAFGRIDILFNNAGICAYGNTHELSEEEWDTMLDINLKGPWLVA